MKTVSIIKYLFTLIGLAMLIGAFFLYKNTSTFLASATRTEGTVIELVRSRSSDSTVYKPVFNFVDDRGATIEVESSSGSNPPSYSVGERVDVFYLPGEPQNAKINSYFSLWGGATIVGGMGGLFLLVGLSILIVPMLKGRKDEYLRQSGTPVSTQFQRVELNRSISVNNRHPFRVVTQWQNPATSEVHVFHSNNLWFDPTEYVGSKNITVFIEQDNPKKYLVDLSFLPKMAE